MSMYSKDIQLKKCSVSLRCIQLKTNSDCINLNDLSPFADDDGLPVSDEKYHAIDSSEHKVSDISVKKKNSFENTDSDSGDSFKSLNSEDVSDSEAENSDSVKAGLKSPDIHSKRMIRKLSDTSLSSAADVETKKEVKTCSVLLHDIGSQLSSDHIDINNLSSDLKKSSDYKRKAVKNSTKGARHNKMIKSDSSSQSSDYEIKEIKKTKQLKNERRSLRKAESRKEAESDSSDDFVFSKGKKQKKFSDSDRSDEDEDYSEKSSKREKRNFRAVKKFGKSRNQSIDEEMRLRKKQRVKYFQNSDSEEEEEEEDDASEKGSSEEDPHPVKVKRSKDWDPDFEDESSNSYEDEDDEDAEIKKDVSGSEKKSSQRKAAETKDMSEYEKMLEKNKSEKLALLESLGIIKARDDISEAVHRMKKKNKVQKEKKTENIIRRSSKRAKADINYNEDTLKRAANLKLTVQSFKTALNDRFFYKRFIDDFEELLEPDTHVVPTPMLYDKNILDQLCHTAHTSRIANPSALLWYPSADDLVLVVGTFNGKLIFWPMKERFDFYAFPMHSKTVSHLKFNPYNSFQMFSSSLDGTLLCCDMQKQMFSEVFEAVDDECTHFDFFSPSSLLVSLKYDQIAILDKRDSRKSRGTSDSDSYVFNKKWHTWDRSSVSTVNVHPVDKNYFITASENKRVCLWDLRYLRQKPLIALSSYDDSVVSAFFSPVTGNALLTTSLDATVRIYDSTKMTEGFIKGHKAFRYVTYNPHRSWLTKASQAVWLPNSDDLFAFSYNQPSPKIQIYDKDFNYIAAIEDKVSSARIFCTFHPFKCALASVNRDKRIYVHT